MMYCPQCGGEYRDGFTQCVDCEVALVATPPAVEEEAEPTPDVGLVSVLETGDPAEMAFAESLLLEAGIDYTKQGDRVQDLFGIGRLGGFNVLTGPAKLLVYEADAEAATQLLRDRPPVEPLAEDELDLEAEASEAD
jgi:hypothetical protein